MFRFHVSSRTVEVVRRTAVTIAVVLSTTIPTEVLSFVVDHGVVSLVDVIVYPLAFYG
jgi:hypothetical protein